MPSDTTKLALAAGELHALAEMITGMAERARRAPEDPEAMLDLARTTARAEEFVREIMEGMASVRTTIMGC